MATTKVKLKELLIILRNGANIKQFEGAKGLPITRIETISDAIINPLKVGYANILDDKYQDYYLKEGDILLSHINSVTHLGKCAIYDNPTEKLIHGMNLLMLRANKELILPKYLYYVLNSKQFKVQLPKITKKSVNQASMTVTDIGNLCLTIEENIDQQQKVIDILDKADEIRQKKKLANDKLDEFLKSTFIDMFGDPIRNVNIKKDRLEKYLLYVQNGISRRRKIPQNIGEIVFRIKEIRENYIDYSDTNRIPLDDKEKEKYRINHNELLFIRVNGNKDYVGRNTVFQGYIEDAYFNDHIMRVKIDEQILNSIYLSRFLNLPFGKEEIRKYIKTSAGQYTINQQGLGAVELPIPPMEKQNKFAQIVRNVEAQKQKNEQVIEQMNNLFNSLSQRAFKGEL